MNEELETAKEELQSTNEELTTVNDELNTRNQEVREINSDLMNILSTVDVPILILDRERRIRRFTPKARNILNVLPSDIGRPLEDIKSNLRLDTLDQQISEVIESNQMHESEVQDRSGCWYRMQIRPYKTVENKIEGATLSLIDIDALKHHVNEAERARGEAERANVAKDEFLATLSHEIRTPLSSMLMHAQLLGRGGLDPTKIKRAADAIERGTRMQVRLVDDLLDVSRITQGKITLRTEPIVLADVVTRAVEMVRPLIDSRGHALEMTLPAEPIALHADPARLAQVLANLLANAANYTPAGGHIRLAAARVGAEAVIRVRDDGVGLASDILPRIFDLFVQGDTSLDRTSAGLGIGLTIVRRLVELHGGRVEAHSDGVGQGSEFVVVLPIEARRAPATGEASPAPGGSARPLRILVVEDNSDAGEALGIVLELWGHTVQVARDAAAALALAADERFDVVVSDLGLPGMDGFALARRLRERPGGPLLIALSGYGSDGDRRRALEAGFDHHVAKPPDLDVLAGILAVAPGAARDRA
jgi:two-component system CheB/CheR fusion protein